MGDFEASRLPKYDLDIWMPLRRTHRDIYQTLRPNQARPGIQLMRLGVYGPDGKHFCPTHMSSAVLPGIDGHMVEFGRNSKQPKAPSQGVWAIPDDVLLALAPSMSDKDGLEDRDIVDHLTEEYGGALLRNSARIRRIRGGKERNSPASSSQETHRVSDAQEGESTP